VSGTPPPPTRPPACSRSTSPSAYWPSRAGAPGRPAPRRQGSLECNHPELRNTGPSPSLRADRSLSTQLQPSSPAAS
jgi:hypothetical protein